MTDRAPLTRTTIAAAQEHAWACGCTRVILWSRSGGYYYDTDDSPSARRRDLPVALVEPNGRVERLGQCKKCKPRRAK